MQPRRIKRGDWPLIPEEKGAFARAQCAEVPGEPVSIWRMELPNTSYWAPQAAFWWVSNEVRR